MSRSQKKFFFIIVYVLLNSIKCEDECKRMTKNQTKRCFKNVCKMFILNLFILICTYVTLLYTLVMLSLIKFKKTPSKLFLCLNEYLIRFLLDKVE